MTAKLTANCAGNTPAPARTLNQIKFVPRCSIKMLSHKGHKINRSGRPRKRRYRNTSVIPLAFSSQTQNQTHFVLTETYFTVKLTARALKDMTRMVFTHFEKAGIIYPAFMKKRGSITAGFCFFFFKHLL